MEQKERRKHPREYINIKAEMISESGKQSCKGVSFDLSPGGARILTNSEITEKQVVLVFPRKKLRGRIIHRESRKSSMMSGQAIYYGVEFASPLSQPEIRELTALAQKT